MSKIAEIERPADDDARGENRAARPAQVDEITLVDLAVVLWRRRWVVAVVFLGTVAVALAYLLMRPDVYLYQATIEVGTRVMDGGTAPVESAISVAAKISNAYAPAVLSEYRSSAAAGSEALSSKVLVSSPNGTNVVVAEIKGPEKNSAIYLQLLDAIGSRVLADHDRIAEVERKDLELQITKIQSERLQLEEEIGLLEGRLKRSDVREAQITGQIKNAERSARQLEEQRQRAREYANNGSEALTLLLIDNEIRQALDRIDELQTEQLATADQKDQLFNEIRLLTRARGEKLQEEEILSTRISNLLTTRLVHPPRRSLRPVGPSGTLVLGLGVVFGAILGVLAAFGSEFALATREQLKGG